MLRFSFAVYLAVFTGTVLGHPHMQLSRPLGIVEKNQPLESRASIDPACPDGFLCSQNSCSPDIRCPDGTVCINLEGTVACAPPGRRWCAINPGTFEAVSCSLDNLCCHGNCYVGNAVCCDNPGTTCTIGDLCGVCNPGQTCGNNGACLGGGTGPITTSTTTTTSTNPPPPPPITTKTSTPTSSSTTTTAPPSPTVVPSVERFENPSCFVDITDSRILLNGTSVDQSTTGMTVEKCVNLSDGWRFAGVEFKGECFWGDILQSNSGSTLGGQCDMACAGDATEICGGGNRILIYEDTTWTNPTRDDLANALDDYNAKVAAFHDLVQQWQDQITQYNQQNPGAKRSVFASAVDHLLGRQVITLEIIAQTRAQVLAAQQILRGVAKPVNTLFNTARNYIKINQNEYGDWIKLQSDVEAQAAAVATDALIDLASAVARKAALDILGGVLKLLGNPLTLVEGTAFSLIKSLINILRPSTGGGGTTPPITTPTPTTTTTTTTTSSSSTTTATPTPFVIITKEGTTSSQFDSLVKTLPPDDRNLDISQASVDLFMIVAYINESFAGEVAQNSIIECMALEVFADTDSVEWSDGTGTATPLPDDSNINLRRELHTAPNAAILYERAAAPQDLILQRSAPNHLQWLSRVDRNGNTAYRFDAAYLYAQETPQQPPSTQLAPDIYIVDSGLNIAHQEFANVLGSGLSFISQWLARHAITPPPGSTTTIQDDNGHGTCMASVAGGQFSGSIKNANIIPVKVDIQTQFIPLGQQALTASSNSITEGLGWILARVNERGQQGQSVVSISQTFDGARLWPPNLAQPPSINPLKSILDRLFDAGVVVLASAGNNAQATPSGPALLADQRTPADLSSPTYPLIVVGGVESDNTRSTFSEIGSTPGIVSIYGYGGLQFCAQKTGTDLYRGSQGTSQATAQVAGLAASYMALSGDQLPANKPDIPLFMKNKLRDTGSTFKGSQPVNEGVNGVAPLASNGLFVGCTTANTAPDVVGILRTPASSGVLNNIKVPISRVVGRPTAPDLAVINRVGVCPDLTTTPPAAVPGA